MSNRCGARITVYENGEKRFILDEPVSAHRCDQDDLYAVIHSRRFVSPENACHALISFAIPEALKPVVAPLLKKLGGAETASGAAGDRIVTVRFSATEVRRLRSVAKKLDITEEEVLRNTVLCMLGVVEQQPENLNLLAPEPQDAIRLPAFK